MNTLTAARRVGMTCSCRLPRSAPTTTTIRQFHVHSNRLPRTASNLGMADAVSPSMKMLMKRGYATPSSVTAASHAVPTPSPTQVTHQRKTDPPTISDRLSSEDSHKIEDWVLYHPVYGKEEVSKVKVVHFENKTLGDKFAAGLVKLFRKGFDIVTGYKHVDIQEAIAKAEKEGSGKMTLKEMREKGLVMTPEQWLARCLFLESIAGVPGMCAAVLRHLRSLRLMRRDGGFIHDLLQEAENERMHLLSFMKMGNPSLFFRLIVLGAQGVFTNAFFFSYLISPRTCHRFVGKLEEEAVYTYTQCIEEIEAGRLPEWEAPAPRIAIDYWRLPEDASIKDMIYAIRTDEAGHRFYNHSIANLENHDFNPFAIRKPSGELQGTNIGFSREQGLEWYENAARDLENAKEKARMEERKNEGVKREGETPTFTTP